MNAIPTSGKWSSWGSTRGFHIRGLFLDHPKTFLIRHSLIGDISACCAWLRGGSKTTVIGTDEHTQIEEMPDFGTRVPHQLG
jgi:hypothetical protein